MSLNGSLHNHAKKKSMGSGNNTMSMSGMSFKSNKTKRESDEKVSKENKQIYKVLKPIVDDY